MKNEQQHAVDEFFKGLPSEDKAEQDVFADKKPVADKAEDKVKDPEEVPESIKNRQHRRLEEKLQKERESNIALAERVKMLSEQDKFSKDTDIDPRIAKMFDTSDVGKENALRLAEILNDMSSKAKQDALQEIANQQESERVEQKSYEEFIDNELEALEDQHNVDLTSDSPQARRARREFLELIEKLSPKDEEGTITGYADFGSTFELYKERHTEKVDNTRQKQIASRSMERGGSSGGESQTKVTPGFRGWEKDYNL